MEKDKNDALVETRKKKGQKSIVHNFQVVEEPIFGKISCANTTNETCDIFAKKSYNGDDRIRQVWL